VDIVWIKPQKKHEIVPHCYVNPYCDSEPND